MPGFSVSGFRCECLLPNKEEKSEEAWEPVFSLGHCCQSVVERGLVCQTLFLSLGKLKSLLLVQCQHYWTSTPVPRPRSLYVRRADCPSLPGKPLYEEKVGDFIRVASLMN